MSELLISEKYEFGAAYQIKLLRLMSTSKDFMRSHRSLLSAKYFEDEIVQDIARLMLDYFDREKETPTVHAMREAVADIIRHDKRRKKLSSAYDKAFESIERASLEEEKDISRRVVEFAQESAAALAILQSLDDLQKGDRSKLLSRLKDALAVGQDEDDLGLIYFEDTTRFAWSRSLDTVGTGLAELDKFLGGGLAIGEHGVVTAPTGGFKSGALVNFAAAALDQGCDVVYITLELGDKVVSQRIDKRIYHRFNGLPPEILKNEAYLEKLKDYQRRIRANLVVKKPKGAFTLSKLRAYLTKLKDRGLVCRPGRKTVLFVDYPKLMKSEGKFEKEINALESLYNGVTEIAQEFEVAAWTAVQTTKIASARLKQSSDRSSGSKIIHKEDLAECFAIAHGVDIILSVNQDFKEMQQNLARIFLAKVREAEDGRVVNVKIDKAMMLILENTLQQAKARRIQTDKRDVEEMLETARASRSVDIDEHDEEGSDE